MILSLFVQIFTQVLRKFFRRSPDHSINNREASTGVAVLCSQVGLKYTRDNQSARVYVQTNERDGSSSVRFLHNIRNLPGATDRVTQRKTRERGIGDIKKRTYNSHVSLHNTAASGLGPGDSGVIAQENDGQFINNSVLVKRLNPP